MEQFNREVYNVIVAADEKVLDEGQKMKAEHKVDIGQGQGQQHETRREGGGSENCQASFGLKHFRWWNPRRDGDLHGVEEERRRGRLKAGRISFPSTRLELQGINAKNISTEEWDVYHKGLLQRATGISNLPLY